MPYAYAYLRVSHEDSARSGAGIAAQTTSVLRMYDELVATDSRFLWGRTAFNSDRIGFYHDSVVSAFKRPFEERPAGLALTRAVKAGDVILVHKTDRLFRSMRDMSNTMQALHRRRVRVRFGDIPMDTSTPEGEMMLSVIVLMGQWESKLKSMRAREAAAIRAAIKAQNQAGYLEGSKNKLHPEVFYVPKEYSRTRSDPGIFATLPPRKDAKAKHPQNGPGRILIYVRCSHLDSVESGLGLEWQRRTCLAEAERLRQKNPLLTIVEEPYTDEAVSAWKHRLIKRPAGKRLDTDLRPGDHVLFARLDRGFRSVRDMGETLHLWQARGAIVKFVSEGLDLSTAWGRGLVTILAQFAEIESELTSTRTKESIAELRKEGRGIKGLIGFQWTLSDDIRSLTPNRRAVALVRLAYWCMRVRKLSREKAAMVIERCVAKRENRPAIPLQGWTVVKAQREFGDDRWKTLVCKKNPHRCTETLVMPYWQGRFVQNVANRWPLLRDYLQKQREAAKTEPASDPKIAGRFTQRDGVFSSKSA